MSVTFRYRAAAANGELVEGELRAPSAHAAIESLRRQTLVPVSVEPSSLADGAPRRARANRLDSVTTSIRAMATLLGAGIQLDRALAFACSQASHPALRAALERVQQKVRAGTSLSVALAAEDDFGAYAAAVVRAGEESGALDSAMNRLADQLERAREVRAQIRGALVYPALMAAVASVGVTVLLLFVVPRFVAMLGDAGGTLPLSTRLLVATSEAAIGWWWVWIPALVLMIAGARQWVRKPANRLRWHAARVAWPVTGELEVKVSAARFLGALGTLLQSGAHALAAIQIARGTVQNEAIGMRIDAAAVEVSHGERMAGALSGAVPPMAAQLLAVGEESGKLDEMCLRAADTLDAEVQRTMRTLVSLLEPAMIVTFGAVVGFIALAMLQAIYGINASVL